MTKRTTKGGGRLECRHDDFGIWFESAYRSNLNGFITEWLQVHTWLHYRWVEGDAVVYLPRWDDV